MSDKRHKQPLYINFPDKTGQRVRLSKQHQLCSKSLHILPLAWVLGRTVMSDYWGMNENLPLHPLFYCPAVCNGECHLEQNVEHINYFYDEFKKTFLKKKTVFLIGNNRQSRSKIPVKIGIWVFWSLWIAIVKMGSVSINPIESSWEWQPRKTSLARESYNLLANYKPNKQFTHIVVVFCVFSYYAIWGGFIWIC